MITSRTSETSYLQKYSLELQPLPYHPTVMFLIQDSKHFTGTFPPQKRHSSYAQCTTAMRRGCKSASSAHDHVSKHTSRYNPISLETFDSQVYTQFYDVNASPNSDDPLTAHRLSLMFMVLAIGSLMNTSLPAYNIEAEKYHQLAKAALFQHPLFDEPTINAVQALVCPSRRICDG